MWSSGQISAGSKTDNGQNFINTFFDRQGRHGRTGAFAIGLLKKEHPEIDFGITPFPGEKGGTGSFAGGDSIAIPKGSKHPDVAYQFMTWCLSDAIQTEYFAKKTAAFRCAPIWARPITKMIPA